MLPLPSIFLHKYSILANELEGQLKEYKYFKKDYSGGVKTGRIKSLRFTACARDILSSLYPWSNPHPIVISQVMPVE